MNGKTVNSHLIINSSERDDLAGEGKGGRRNTFSEVSVIKVVDLCCSLLSHSFHK